MINLKDKKKEEWASFPFWSVFAWEILLIQGLLPYRVKDTSKLSRSSAGLQRGVLMGNRSDGECHCAPPFGGTVFIFLVLVVTSTCLLGDLGQRQMPSASSLVQGRASKSFPTEARERRVGSLHQTAKNGVFSLHLRPLPHPPNSICHYICQSGLKSPLRQGAWEEQSTTWISNTECTYLRTESHQYPEGSPSCQSRA